MFTSEPVLISGLLFESCHSLALSADITRRIAVNDDLQGDTRLANHWSGVRGGKWALSVLMKIFSSERM